MKAKHIKLIREKISSKKFIESQLDKLADEMKRWNTYEQFDCSDFFQGYLKAKRNRKTLDRNMNRIWNKITFYQSLNLQKMEKIKDEIIELLESKVNDLSIEDYKELLNELRDAIEQKIDAYEEVISDVKSRRVLGDFLENIEAICADYAKRNF